MERRRGAKKLTCMVVSSPSLVLASATAITPALCTSRSTRLPRISWASLLTLERSERSTTAQFTSAPAYFNRISSAARSQLSLSLHAMIVLAFASPASSALSSLPSPLFPPVTIAVLPSMHPRMRERIISSFSIQLLSCHCRNAALRMQAGGACPAEPRGMLPIKHRKKAWKKTDMQVCDNTNDCPQESWSSNPAVSIHKFHSLFVTSSHPTSPTPAP
eukprot:751557-Hanusia_phi.AAC.3